MADGNALFKDDLSEAAVVGRENLVQDDASEEEISALVDKRIADIFGFDKIEASKALPEEPVMATPSVLSLVRATAYAHC